MDTSGLTGITKVLKAGLLALGALDSGVHATL
jgi:hypothetical protein